MNICAKVLGCNPTGDNVNFQIAWEAHLPDGRSMTNDFTIDQSELGAQTNARIVDHIRASALEILGVALGPTDKITLLGGRV